MKNYTKLYQLKKELNNMEIAKDALLKTDFFSSDQMEKLDKKIDEINHTIEKTEKGFRGKGYYEDIVTEIAYSYCQDEKFRNEIQGVMNLEKYKMFIFSEFMEAFENELFVQRLFTLNLLNKMIARAVTLQTKVHSAEKIASNLATFFKSMENGEEFFSDMIDCLVRSNKTFFVCIAGVDSSFKELIIQNKQH